jgi:hypothetical protein
MKRLFLILICSFSLLSCERELLIPNSEVPDWLKDRIAHDEALIRDSPQSGLDIAAWIRYKYEGKYFFEYLNLLSSAFPSIYTYEGMRAMSNPDEYQAFSLKRCCKQYVWKGKSYFETDSK